MENHMKFCPNCGSELMDNDRFCRDCGFATEERREAVAESRSAPEVQTAAGGVENFGKKGGGNQKAFVILISVLAMAVMFLVGVGVHWWLTREDAPASEKPSSSETKMQKEEASELDLSRAATYFPESGLACTFYANYPDGAVGIVTRISGQVVPNESVRVSEVELGVDQGEEFGFGVHYVERADGTYYIYDDSPFEIMPLLKNDLSVGQSWNYQSEYGQITWTVLEMGVDLDLGFAVFEDCLKVQEDNQMAGFESITYYAPNRGSVLVIDPSGSMEYYKMTALQRIETTQAVEQIIHWCPNYAEIRDDRTQSD